MQSISFQYWMTGGTGSMPTWVSQRLRPPRSRPRLRKLRSCSQCFLFELVYLFLSSQRFYQISLCAQLVRPDDTSCSGPVCLSSNANSCSELERACGAVDCAICRCCFTDRYYSKHSTEHDPRDWPAARPRSVSKAGSVGLSGHVRHPRQHTLA
jgi:hypothetical protein